MVDASADGFPELLAAHGIEHGVKLTCEQNGQAEVVNGYGVGRASWLDVDPWTFVTLPGRRAERKLGIRAPDPPRLRDSGVPNPINGPRAVRRSNDAK